jgi:Protein of unknown function (DUF1161)
MKVSHFFGVAPLIAAVIPVTALARDCNEVKAEIDAKIKAKGVMNYVLQIVNGPDVKEGKVVGNCDVGTKTIVYLREPSSKNALEARSTSPKQAEPLLPPAPAPATPIAPEASR